MTPKTPSTKNESFGPSPSEANPTGRARAIDLLARQAARFPDLLPASIDDQGLDSRETALATTIYDAAIRRWLTLSFLLNKYLKRPLSKSDPLIQAALLAGAAQLLLLDRIPPHAAVNESVTWVRNRQGKQAAGLVNAILRRISELAGQHLSEPWDNQTNAIPLADGSIRMLNADALPTDPIKRLSIATSCPEKLFTQWQSDTDPKTAEQRALHLLSRPPIILNTQHANPPLPDLPILSPHTAKGHAVFSGTRAELIHLLAQHQCIWVQDPSSSAAIQSVSDTAPKVIIDACAGLGTKTRQLAATFPNATIIASDQDPAKLDKLAAIPSLTDRVILIPLDQLASRCPAQADLVLLDVPCSNTGVLPRRLEARYRHSPSQSKRLIATQRQIIANAIPLLSPKGSILYATCSLDPQENHAQTIWACQTHNLSSQGERLTEPQGSPECPAETYSDGAYSTILTPASPSTTKG